MQELFDQLDGVKIEEASTKRIDKVQNFEDLIPTTKIDAAYLYID